jgi:CBS domain-containing protein
VDVKELMTTGVVTATTDQSLKDVAKTLVERGSSGMPVCDEEDRVVR